MLPNAFASDCIRIETMWQRQMLIVAVLYDFISVYGNFLQLLVFFQMDFSDWTELRQGRKVANENTWDMTHFITLHFIWRAIFVASFPLARPFYSKSVLQSRLCSFHVEVLTLNFEHLRLQVSAVTSAESIGSSHHKCSLHTFISIIAIIIISTEQSK